MSHKISGGSRQKFGGNWRKTKNQIFKFSEILPEGLIPMRYGSFWSEVMHLAVLRRSRQKFGGNWRKTAKIMLLPGIRQPRNY